MSDEQNIQERVDTEVEKRLSDPAYLQAKLQAVVARNRDLKDKTERVFGSGRDYSMARIAEDLQLEYSRWDESKNKWVLLKMGQNILHRLFAHDSIVAKRGAEGYRLTKAYERYGRTVSHDYQLKNGQWKVRDSVVFSGRGLEYLIERYRMDDRRFRIERWAGYTRFVAE